MNQRTKAQIETDIELVKAEIAEYISQQNNYSTWQQTAEDKLDKLKKELKQCNKIRSGH